MKTAGNKFSLFVVFMVVVTLLVVFTACKNDTPKQDVTKNDAPKKIEAGGLEDIGLSEQDIIDSYIYILARYLVIRQEHIDMADERALAILQKRAYNAAYTAYINGLPP